MATHCSILAWEITWTEKPWGRKRVRYNLTTKQQHFPSIDQYFPIFFLSIASKRPPGFK